MIGFFAGLQNGDWRRVENHTLVDSRDLMGPHDVRLSGPKAVGRGVETGCIRPAGLEPVPVA